MHALRIRGLLVVGAALLGTLAIGSIVPAEAQPVVAVTQIVEHPALDAVRKGVKDGLEARGFIDGKTLRWQYQSAQGSPVTATQIAKKFAGDEPAVIVAISTPSAQTVAAANTVVPVVFGAVTDAISTRIVADLERPGANITGVLTFPPVGKQMDLLQQIAPAAKRIGVIYNAGEANSVAIMAVVRQEVKARSLTLVETTVSKSSDVGGAAESLVGKVDAILVAGDNTVTTALEAVVRVAVPARLPIVCGDPKSPERGCTAAVGYDWYASGRQMALIVADVLGGSKPGTIAVQAASSVELVLNAKVADQMGLDLPSTLMSSANNVVR